MHQITKDQQRRTALGFNRWSRVAFKNEEITMMIDFVNDSTRIQNASEFHNHWIKCKVLEGWKFGLYYSEDMKTDPRMCEFSQLDEDVRQHLTNLICILNTFA